MSCASTTSRKRSAKKKGTYKKKRRTSSAMSLRRTMPASVGFSGPRIGLPEKKYFDSGEAAVVWPALGGAPVASLYAVGYVLNSVNNGAGVSARVGRKITMTSCQLRIGVAPSTSLSEFSTRIILVYDSQTNGVATVPLVTTLLESTPTLGVAGTYVPTQFNINQPVNMANRDRYRILMDKMVPLGPDQADLGHVIKKYKRLRHETVFNTDVIQPLINVPQQIQTGALYLFFLAQPIDTTAVTPAPNISFTSRLRYVDLG